MEYGLIGERLPHSFSQEIHESLGQYRYDLKEIVPERLDEFMTERAFKGINVTIPYKQQVIPYLDEISPRAEAIGAVNTIVNKDGKLFGDNTDFGGVQALIAKLGLDLAGGKVLILGTGGTSKTARAVAQAAQAACVLRVSRSGREDAITYEEAYASHGDADFIINTTPCGMFPKVDDCPVDLDRFTQLKGVIDAIYNPLDSCLVTKARRRGIPAEGGLYMLVAQAVLAAKVFTGREYAPSVIDYTYNELLVQKRNFVLIGMPGSGKTTVGKAIAMGLDRDLVDTDVLVEEKAGCTISEIFATQGEEAFRDMETQVLAELAGQGGLVIATGGGVPLREENIDLLRMNGYLFFLDRPLETLVPTDDRPLANEVSKIQALYEERLPIYEAACDYRVVETADDEPMDVAFGILRHAQGGQW